MEGTMLDFFRDSLWQFISVIVAVILFIASILVNRKKKSLIYEMLAFTPILSVGDALKEKIKVTYDNEPVDNIKLGVMKIQNDGNVPIKPDDFIKPLAFFFGEESQILNFEILESRPPGIVSKFEKKDGILLFDPLYLNQNDYFIFRFIVSNLKEQPVAAPYDRLVGVKMLNKVVTSYKQFFITFLLTMVLLITTGITVSISTVFYLNDRASIRNQPLYLIFTSILVGITFLFLVYFSIQEFKKGRERKKIIKKYLVNYVSKDFEDLVAEWSITRT
jgi:hypothetical protein